MKHVIGVIAAALSADAREAVVRSRKLGFEGVVFDAFSPRLSLPELSQSGRREFRHLLSSQDQRLIGLRADLGPRGLSAGADVDQVLARVEQGMEAAAGLAAPLVCVDLGPLSEPARAAPPRPKVDPAAAGLIIIPSAADLAAVGEPEPEVKGDPAAESAVDAALAELGRRADRYSVMVAFRSELASFAALERALRAAACPWFGVELDPVAVLRDSWGVDEVLSRLAGQVRHVRVRDATKGHDRRTQPAVVGRGDVNWGELRARLDEAGYSGALTVDPLELADRAAAARAGLEVVRGLGG